MISPKLRMGLILLFVAAGIGSLFLKTSWLVPVSLFGTALIMLVGHFRYGPMLGVLTALKRGQIDKAQALLQSIKRPEWLSNRFRGYYHFSLSLVATYSQDIETAEEHAKQALEVAQLPAPEKGILYYNLARAAFEKKEWEASKRHLDTLLTFPIKDLQLKKRIEELQDALKKTNG